MIIGTADAAYDLINRNEKDSKGRFKIPTWVLLLFFVLIYGSALLAGLFGGFAELEQSHIVRAIAYWAFASCLVIILPFIIYKSFKNK